MLDNPYHNWTHVVDVTQVTSLGSRAVDPDRSPSLP